MNFHEFGKENKNTILLLHPLGVDWHFFEYVYPILAVTHHVIIPAIPGMDSSVKMLGYMFDPKKYTREDLLYVKSVLKNMSAKTIWRAFWSTNNYSMPKIIHQPDTPINYWYGENEKKARKSDITFVKDTFKNVIFTENKGQDHAEFASLYPEEFCERFSDIKENYQCQR